MPSAVIVIGAVEGVRRELERRVKDRAHLLIIRLTREGQGGFRLEPYVDNAIQMVEAASDKAEDYGRVLVIQLPYASCQQKLLDTIAALESLGATVLRPGPAVSPWPSRPNALDDRFRQALQNALSSTIEDWLPGEQPEESLDDAIQRARTDFAETLDIPADVVVETHLQGTVWYRALQAMDELCRMERRGEAPNKRDILRELLGKHIGVAKGTYKVGDTGLHVTVGGKRVEVRERVHLREGRPTETESIYWATAGEKQATYRYLIRRIGRHA